MCQYSSDNGHATDWHFVHIGVSNEMLFIAASDTQIMSRGMQHVEQAVSAWRPLRLSQKAAYHHRTQ